MRTGSSNFRANAMPVRGWLGAFFVGCSVLASCVAACATADSVVVGNDLDSGANFGDGSASGPFTEAPGDGGADAAKATPMKGQCATTECPEPFATCPMDPSTGAPGSTYACDTNTSNDPNNCGECGHVCQQGFSANHTQETCAAGHCTPFCDTGWVDCNGLAEDGCEAFTSFDTNNCGACGIKCAAGVDCIDGSCGCPAGLTFCFGRCVDTSSDDDNCGGCDVWCANPANQPPHEGPLPANMQYDCFQGSCSALNCQDKFADCNDDIELDGCEVNLGQPNNEHCGQCNNACDASHTCFSTYATGMACQCPTPMTICSGNSCADLESDPTNCGSCGYACPSVDGADAACHQGRCSYTCLPGRADCNGQPIDGCEVDLAKDPRHCGACETSCEVGFGQPCVNGRCATTECDGGPVH